MISLSEEMRKRVSSIVERLSKKVDSLNYQNISFNQKCSQQAKDEFLALLEEATHKAREQGRRQALDRPIRIPKPTPTEYTTQPIDSTHVPLEYRWMTVGAYYDQRNREASKEWYDKHKGASAIVVNQDGDALYALYVSPLGSHNESVDHLFKTLRARKYFEDEFPTKESNL